MEQTQVNEYELAYEPTGYIVTPCKQCGAKMLVKKLELTDQFEKRTIKCENGCKPTNGKKTIKVVTPRIDREHFEL